MKQTLILPACVDEGHKVPERVMVALGDHDHVKLLGQGGREGVKQLLVDGAPTVTEDYRHLSKVGGAMVAAEVG